MGSIPVRVTIPEKGTTRVVLISFFGDGDSYEESHPATYVAGFAYATQSASS